MSLSLIIAGCASPSGSSGGNNNGGNPSGNGGNGGGNPGEPGDPQLPSMMFVSDAWADEDEITETKYVKAEATADGI